MAEAHHKCCDHECETNPAPTTNVESTDRGLFDFLGKKEEEKPKVQEEEVIVAEFEKVTVSELPEEHKLEEHKQEEEVEKKPSLLEKLHRSDSSSSSSSSDDEEEVKEGGEKKKKKKGLKEKIKEKIGGEKEGEKKKVEEEKEEEDISVPIEKCEYVTEVEVPVPPQVETVHPEEKKGFLEKIKDKLPGHKKPEEANSPPPVPSPFVTDQAECAGEVHPQEGEAKEKKGIFEKIKGKIPGYNKNSDQEKKEEAAGGY